MRAITAIVICCVIFFGIMAFGRHKGQGKTRETVGTIKKSSELVPIDTVNWTIIITDSTKEWFSTTIMDTGLYYTVVIDGDFENPISLPGGSGIPAELKGEEYRYKLDEGQRKQRSKLLIERKPR